MFEQVCELKLVHSRVHLYLGIVFSERGQGLHVMPFHTFQWEA